LGGDEQDRSLNFLFTAPSMPFFCSVNGELLLSLPLNETHTQVSKKKNYSYLIEVQRSGERGLKKCKWFAMSA
jgi:hypothetical protein